MDRDAEQTLRALVRRVAPGARIYFPRKRAYRVGYSWNGRHLRPTGVTLESQLHEVAHVLLCPPERLPVPEFGLGADPYRRSYPPVRVSKPEADREELDACALQLLLAGELGLDEAAVKMEFSTATLTPERVRALRGRYPGALPAAYWERAETRAHDA